jgi:undecaprenyl-diphosphatase
MDAKFNAMKMSPRALRILVALFISAGALWIFQEVVEDLVFGGANTIDMDILLVLRAPSNPSLPRGPVWLAEFARDVTSLGSIDVLTLVTLATILFLIFAGRRRTALTVASAIFSGVTLNLVVKAIIDRPRPDVLLHAVPTYGSSFPSGHAMMSAIVYLTLAALVSRIVPGVLLKSYIVALAVLVTLLVGASRVYLAVHWPSDVLGGWSLGAAWALLCWAVVEWREGKAARS